jgi:hypothetical protein
MRLQARKFGGMFKKRMNVGGAAKAAPTKPEPRPSNWQDVQDEKTRKKEDKAPTTKTDMGKPLAKGGRIKRYAEGGEADDATMEQSLTDSKSFGEAFRAARSRGDKTFTYRGEPYNTELRSDKPAASKTSTSTSTSRTAEVKATPSGETDAGAKAGRTYAISKKAPSPEQKEENASRLGDIGMGIASAVPAVRALRGAAVARGVERAERAASSPMGRVAERQAEMAKTRAGRVAEARKDAAYDARRMSDMEAGFRKGGKVKEAQMEMRHAKAMKKAGLPKSMVREEMSEAKKYARGGGIESRGKTKGTVIKMASGGSVSARADGCAQRGKTKGRMI